MLMLLGTSRCQDQPPLIPTQSSDRSSSAFGRVFVCYERLILSRLDKAIRNQVIKRLPFCRQPISRTIARPTHLLDRIGPQVLGH
jgi:hypothetical protein